jgi:DNA-binding winged helix-turn-helix (wHTH) protein/Flp pilus assembly protein TadD
MPTRQVYEFGAFCVDTREQALYCEGKVVPLPLKTFALLQVLVEHAGRLVTKEDLMKTCWPDTFVEEANIAVNISLLRRAIRDDPHDSRYIQTVYRLGYRFIAPVAVENSGGLSRSVSPNGEIKKALKSAAIDRCTAETRHAYLRGRYYMKRYTVEGLTTAIVYFQRAISADSHSPLGYAGLAESYYMLSNIHLPPREAMPLAKEAAVKALQLDQTLAETHSVLGLIAFFYEHDWKLAEQHLRTAIELADDSTLSHTRFGLMLGLCGRFDEAISHMKIARDADPQSPAIRVGLGTVFHLARQYDEALEQAEFALDQQPEFFPARILSGVAGLQRGRFAEAIEELKKAASISTSPIATGYLGYGYAISGRLGEAVELLRRLETESETHYVSPYYLALIHHGLGQTERALWWLKKTYDERNEMFAFVRTSPEFDDLRSDKRFIALIYPPVKE